MGNTQQRDHLRLYVVSDSTGETGEAIARAWVSQFPNLQLDMTRFSHVDTNERLEELRRHEKPDVIINSIVIPEMKAKLQKQCEAEGILFIDLFDQALSQLESLTGHQAVRKPRMTRELNPAYFNKISSIEFAVKYDDGKDPRGLLKADIVLLGISRTSKTPLSMHLAHRGYNVANLPLVPEVRMPVELNQVDPRRVIGLILSDERLNAIRMERLQSLGLSVSSSYAAEDRIQKELDYARSIFAKLGCTVLDVSDSTIEQTASQVLEIVRKKINGPIRRYEQP